MADLPIDIWKPEIKFNTSKYLEILSRPLKSKAKILDIGCGSGEPVDQFLINQGYQLSGIDISETQIELAKARIPQAHYCIKDMSELREKNTRLMR